MNDLPRDPVMLLSVVNTGLRDHYESLEELCGAYGVTEDDLKARLEAINYFYDESLNQFK